MKGNTSIAWMVPRPPLDTSRRQCVAMTEPKRTGRVIASIESAVREGFHHRYATFQPGVERHLQQLPPRSRGVPYRPADRLGE